LKIFISSLDAGTVFCSDCCTFVSAKNRDLYYLFPGQGGRAKRKRMIRDLIVAAVVGLITAGLIAAIFYAWQH
jgi:hypothetical protein